MSTGFIIAKDTLSPVLTRLAGKLSPVQRSGFVLAWGRGVAAQAQRNARAKGGRRFWRDLARSVNMRSISAEGVEVFSDHVAAAQAQFGGTIEAPGKGPGSHQAKALTIPFPGSEAERTGETAKEFVLGGRKLFVLGKKDGVRMGVLGYDENGQFVPLFILRRRVTQKARPWFPDAQAVLDIGTKFAEKKLSA